MSPATPAPAAAAIDTEATLRAVIEPLAALERGAGSPGERRAAELLAGMLENAGAAASVDEEHFRDGYAKLLLPLGVAGFVAARLVGTGRGRALGGVLAAAAAALTVDDVENGRRVWRRLVTRPKPTWNVVAEVGDPEAIRTLVVMGHHDAAPTGHAFDQSFQRWLAGHHPELHPAHRHRAADLVAGRRRAGPHRGRGPARPPAAGPHRLRPVGAVGRARRRHRPRARSSRARTTTSAARRPWSALAERLRDEPVAGVRVLLVSCGAEEVLQGGIYGFVERHLRRWTPPARGCSTSTPSARRS